MFAIKIENLFAIEIEHVFPLKLKFQINYVYNDFILTHLIFIFILTFVNLNYTLLVLAVIYFWNDAIKEKTLEVRYIVKNIFTMYFVKY
jgi:hypothetical protein